METLKFPFTWKEQEDFDDDGNEILFYDITLNESLGLNDRFKAGERFDSILFNKENKSLTLFDIEEKDCNTIGLYAKSYSIHGMYTFWLE